MKKPFNQVPLLIFLLAIVWGSSFILMKRALVIYTPYQVGAVRMMVAFLALLPVIISRFKKIDKAKWKYFAATGFLGNGIPSVLFPLAETRISSALAGMLNSMTPVFTLMVGMLWFGMKPERNKIFGLVVGLAGAVILIFGQTGGEGIYSGNAFALFIVVAAICYAFSVNILRNKLNNYDSLTNTGFALLFAGIPMSVYVFSTDFIERTASTPGSGFGLICIILLGLFGTALSTILFNRLIKLSDALAASSVTYLIPIVAVIWGFLDGEQFLFFHLIGLVAILSGVYLINKHNDKIQKGN